MLYYICKITIHISIPSKKRVETTVREGTFKVSLQRSLNIALGGDKCATKSVRFIRSLCSVSNKYRKRTFQVF